MLPVFLSLLLIFSPYFSIECSSQPPPALYVFGDSASDAGNNNRLPVLQWFAKSNYRPYGQNFPNGPTGRFSNGKTFADFIAGYLGLPYPAAYMEASRSQTGYTYASGGCGILQETGGILKCLRMDEQLILFQRTIDEELRPRFENPRELSEHLANSVFLVWAGSNDYLLTYFNDENPALNPQQFAQHLINRLSDQLKTLHELGARKFVVLELGPLGCAPVYRINGGHEPTWCDDDKNDNAIIFNGLLATLVTQTMPTSYPDSRFTLGKVYDLAEDAFKNPAKYGLTNVHSTCCATSPNFNNIPCRPPWTFPPAPCTNPQEYMFFDGAHPTEASFEMLAKHCFDGSTCVPNNIQQLSQLPINSANLHSAA